MSGIPERGYGSWAQWKRRWGKRGGSIFFVNGDDNRIAQERWVARHGQPKPEGGETTIREATEAQA